MSDKKQGDILEADVRRILLQKWDPIGIKDIAEAADEYDPYVPSLCVMLRNGDECNKIYCYLRWIETERIGLDGDEVHTQRIATELSLLTPPS